MALKSSRRSLNLYNSVLQFNLPRKCVASSPARLYNHQPYRFTSFPSRKNLFRPFSILPQRFNSKATVHIDTLGGESVDEGKLHSFNHKVGDYVEQHDVLAFIETEKVALEVYAPESGVIQHRFVEEGDTVTIGQAIAEITVKSKLSNESN
ncbi:single hybrid motif-containing protein [Aspergillus caelatus]|uniref:Single hybrid motif-containing protein n=1 Tax=Aspergillus caelatus TaxID=61420 RepID=A0A5N7AAA0_9EURO|nr:single hybrid motif-containing protein [Aspergillus caelatus]KAE8366563.1 single hybrid motif-containing protein [Aspergillus caelatus]